MIEYANAREYSWTILKIQSTLVVVIQHGNNLTAKTKN